MLRKRLHTMDIVISNQITAKDLNFMAQMRETKHKEVYVIILERIYSRIRRCASVSMTNCKYEIPEVVIGHPMFDVERCVSFVIRHLVMNGFEVSKTFGFKFLIDISWEPISSKKRYLNSVTEDQYNYNYNPNNFAPVMFQEHNNISKAHSHNMDNQILSVRKKNISAPYSDINRGTISFRPIDTFVARTIIPKVNNYTKST